MSSKKIMEILKKILVITLQCFTLGFAQNHLSNNKIQPPDSSNDKTAYFSVSLNYLSNSVYNGRTDTGSTLYITPTLSYHFNNGLYISSGVSFLPIANSRIDLSFFEADYDIDLTEKLSASFFANKSYYSSNSTSTASDVKGYLGGEMSYDLNFATIATSADMVFTKKKDYELSLELYNDYSFGNKKNGYTITPKILVNTGTLNFYNSYANKRRKNLDPMVESQSKNTIITNRKANQLTLLDYEISTKINYHNNNWEFLFCPTLSIPQNTINTETTTISKFTDGTVSTKIENSTPQSELNLKNLFYFEIGIEYKF